MRPHILKLFLLLVFALAFVRAGAQTQAENCEGALGDPVISEDFGSGVANPGPPLPSGITTMSYVTICPEDGEYTILNHITLEGDRPNCKPGGAWRLLTHDHTGNPNGYMMVINASRDPSEFF